MFCEKCGEKISDSAAFCKKCGAKTESEEDTKSGNKIKTAAPLSEESDSTSAPNSEQIKQYLGMVFDMETNLYVQRQTITNLCEERNSLGNRIEYAKPCVKVAKADYESNIGSVAVIVGIIAWVIFTFKFCDSGMCSAMAFLPGLIIAIPIGAIAGFIIGPIIAHFSKKSDQEEMYAQYRMELEDYNKAVKADEERVNEELAQRRQIQGQIDQLERKKKESERFLKELYGYNIIDSRYHYNIVAIGTFYEYFDTGRTKSLGFNERTGDQGAYNLYSTDSKLGKIIENTSIIIEQIDEVIENQREVARAMGQAVKKIDVLTSSVNRLDGRLDSLNDSIKESNAINAYNGERTQAELSYMNSLNTMNFISNSGK